MRFVLRRGKRPAEVIRRGIDFARDVETVTGDAIQSFQVTASEMGGADTTASMIEAPALVPGGSVVEATIKGGTAGKKYLVLMHVETASGKKYDHDILVPVSSDA